MQWLVSTFHPLEHTARFMLAGWMLAIAYFTLRHYLLMHGRSKKLLAMAVAPHLVLWGGVAIACTLVGKPEYSMAATFGVAARTWLATVMIALGGGVVTLHALFSLYRLVHKRFFGQSEEGAEVESKPLLVPEPGSTPTTSWLKARGFGNKDDDSVSLKPPPRMAEVIPNSSQSDELPDESPTQKFAGPGGRTGFVFDRYGRTGASGDPDPDRLEDTLRMKPPHGS